MSKGTVRKKIFAKGSRSSGGGDPTIPGRVTNLENNEYKIAYFTEINSQTGTITIPTGATILLNQLPAGADALVATKDATTGLPTGENPQTSLGIEVDVATFDASGNYTLTGNCSSYPVCLIYWLSIKAVDYSNLSLSNILEEEVYHQSDWNETDPTLPSYIRNKPGIILPYISIDWNDVYSTTMTGAGSLVEGQLYRVTGIPLFPLGYGIKTGYFMAYANRTDATPRVYLNSQGYGRLWQFDPINGSAPSGLTAVVEIDWYLSAGAQAGSPEWFSFEVPEWNQKSHRTYDTTQTVNDAIFVVEWGTSAWKGINFHDVKLLKWNKTCKIYQCQIERTTIDNNNSQDFVLKWSHVIANKLTVRANALTVSEHDIYAPSEDLNIGFSTQYGRYATGLQGNIKLRLNWNTAYDNVDKLTIPQYADLIGIFELYDEEKQDGVATQIVGGYSTTTPFLFTESLTFGSVASFQPYSFSTEDATHNIWQTILTDQLNIFSAFSLDKTRIGTKLLLSYYDNTAAGTRNDVLRIESAYITA